MREGGKRPVKHDPGMGGGGGIRDPFYARMEHTLYPRVLLEPRVTGACTNGSRNCVDVCSQYFSTHTHGTLLLPYTTSANLGNNYLPPSLANMGKNNYLPPP
jgi:hypothetical protein